MKNIYQFEGAFKDLLFNLKTLAMIEEMNRTLRKWEKYNATSLKR